jgi:hypothetical protein
VHYHYSCKVSDDINTDYVVASCSRNAPFVGGYDSKDIKWHLRQIVQGTKHVVPDLVTYFMICHDYDGRGDLLSLAKKLGYNIPEQAEWQEHRPANLNENGQEERVYDSLDSLATDATEGKLFGRKAPLSTHKGKVTDAVPVDVTDVKTMLGDWYKPDSPSVVHFEMRPNLTVRETYSNDGTECFYANFDPVPYRVDLVANFYCNPSPPQSSAKVRIQIYQNTNLTMIMTISCYSGCAKEYTDNSPAKVLWRRSSK